MKKIICGTSMMENYAMLMEIAHTYRRWPRPLRRRIIRAVWPCPWRWLWYVVLLGVGFMVGSMVRIWVDWWFVFEAGRLMGEMGR